MFDTVLLTLYQVGFAYVNKKINFPNYDFHMCVFVSIKWGSQLYKNSPIKDFDFESFDHNSFSPQIWASEVAKKFKDQ